MSVSNPIDLASEIVTAFISFNLNRSGFAGGHFV